nr:cyclase-associated protein 1-like [Ipomoea batatas]
MQQTAGRKWGFIDRNPRKKTLKIIYKKEEIDTDRKYFNVERFVQFRGPHGNQVSRAVGISGGPSGGAVFRGFPALRSLNVDDMRDGSVDSCIRRADFTVHRGGTRRGKDWRTSFGCIHDLRGSFFLGKTASDQSQGKLRKVNNITLDKCSKMGVLFTDVVAAFELVNCKGIEVQCQGIAPTISVDNTSGVQLYLSKNSLEASITTAESTEINVSVPAKEGLDYDWEEHALPQQFAHVYKDGQFETVPVTHSSGG